MIKNYLKIAIRTLWKNKLFSFVNILGLSLSMAVGVILFTGLKATFDTDHFHPELNQKVRILTQETNDEADVPVEFHLYQNGGHGFGLGNPNRTSNRWFDAFIHWLEVNGILAANS